MANYRVIIEGGSVLLPDGRQAKFGEVFDAVATGFGEKELARIVNAGEAVEVEDEATYKPDVATFEKDEGKSADEGKKGAGAHDGKKPTK